jgi:uncharacterized Zn-binding protein involved in type VI secretion
MAQPVARKGDLTLCPSTRYILIPHLGGPLSNATPVCIEVNSLPVIRLGDYGHCQFGAPLDVVFEGALSVTVCGLPVARRFDGMVHGGMILQGSSNVEVGGPKFSLPSKLKVKGPSDFQNKTIRDLYLLSTTKSGQDMFNQIDASGKNLTIEPCPDPHNSFASAANDTDAKNGTGSDATVQYHPEVAIYGFDAAGNQITMPPQVVLGHELSHALHDMTGTAQTESNADPDPNAPKSQPNIEKEEAQAIGTGSWDGTSPTENSIRSDLGLPRRDNHYGTDGLVRDSKGKITDRTNELKGPTQDLRPGDCK